MKFRKKDCVDAIEFREDSESWPFGVVAFTYKNADGSLYGTGHLIIRSNQVLRDGCMIIVDKEDGYDEAMYSMSKNQFMAEYEPAPEGTP